LLVDTLAFLNWEMGGTEGKCSILSKSFSQAPMNLLRKRKQKENQKKHEQLFFFNPLRYQNG
jgi:hypothetical protein